MKEQLKTAAADLTLVVFLTHAWVTLTSGAGLNLVSGVWLALARDCQDGLFYRGLLSDAGYGGTRYFPLFFMLIASFMRAGVGSIGAGYAASLAGAAVLVAGAYACARQLELSRPSAWLVASLTIAPYFVQESVFAIRSEPLAAGLALSGAACVLSLARRPSATWMRAVLAAGLFTAAIAAKPTAVSAPVAAVLALLFGRRRADAARVSLLSAAGVVLLISAIAFASDGRAVESFRVGALGGQPVAALFTLATLTRPVALIATSHLLSVMFLLVVVAMITGGDDWYRLPSLLVLATAVVMAVVLASPGTILANQIVELYVVAAVFLGWIAHTRTRWKRTGSAVIGLILLWAAAQNVVRIMPFLRGDPWSTLSAERESVVRAFKECGGTVLAESPLVPLLAGTRPLLLDPFAFRVVALRRPEIGADLIGRLRAREFSCVILEHDPHSSRGGGWYRNVHLGWQVIEAVLEQYEYRGSVGPHRFYAPR